MPSSFRLDRLVRRVRGAFWLNSPKHVPARQIEDVSDVFGLARKLPLNYVRRDRVDGAFYRSLNHERNLVVYGSSKQGKTSLCRQSLPSGSYIRVACQPGWSLAQLHSQVLKMAGYTIELSESQTLTGEQKIIVRNRGALKLAGLEASGDHEEADGISQQLQRVTKTLELDPADVNDITSALGEIGFEKYIILEDFHYLEISTQRQFAHSLKAFYDESSIRFVIVGVWLDENRLFHFNRDLTGRVEAISADDWPDEQLREVITRGSELLSLDFHTGFVNYLIDNCYNSVWIVQEACYRLCVESGVEVGKRSPGTLGSATEARRLISEIIDSQSTQYMHFIRAFTQKAEAALRDVYGWLIAVILLSDTGALRHGIELSQIYDFIKDTDPKGFIGLGALEEYLRNLSSYQVATLQLNPIIVDFDGTHQRLRVTDRGFLVWLDSRDRQELLDEADVPLAFTSKGKTSRRSGRHGRPDT